MAWTDFNFYMYILEETIKDCVYDEGKILISTDKHDIHIESTEKGQLTIKIRNLTTQEIVI